MLTRVLLVSAIVLTIAAALAAPKLMRPDGPDRPGKNETGAVLPAQPPAEQSRVQVQQTFVQPVEVVETGRTLPVAARRNGAVRTASAKRAPETFIAKAARTLIGDGRYRPEPFPRAR